MLDATTIAAAARSASAVTVDTSSTSPTSVYSDYSCLDSALAVLRREQTKDTKGAEKGAEKGDKPKLSLLFFTL